MDDAVDKIDSPLGFRPLYRQVQELLTGRLIANHWRPGALLPSEFQLADELGVSQGTVRKALDELTALGLLVRRQGRGTFVAEHDQAHALFHFFRLVRKDGTPLTPKSVLLSCGSGRGSAAECEKLDLAVGAKVIRLERLRELDAVAAIHELLVLPFDLFPGMADLAPLPNTLYSYFAHEHGVMVARADEGLSAVAADSRTAKALGIEKGSPLLEIDRVARALDGTAVEWRVSRCRTEQIKYQLSLS